MPRELQNRCIFVFKRTAKYDFPSSLYLVVRCIMWNTHWTNLLFGYSEYQIRKHGKSKIIILWIIEVFKMNRLEIIQGDLSMKFLKVWMRRYIKIVKILTPHLFLFPWQWWQYLSNLTCSNLFAQLIPLDEDSWNS